MEHIKNLKAQGTNVGVDEDKINDLINKISDKKDARNKYIDLEIDKFLDKYEYTNIYVRYNKNENKFDTDEITKSNICVRYNKNENKFDTDEITKSLKKLRNKLIDAGEFNEKYNKFVDHFTKFEYYKSEKEPGSVSPNPKKMIRYAKSLKDIVDFYNPRLGNFMSKKGEGLEILNNKQMLNLLPILLAQIEAEIIQIN